MKALRKAPESIQNLFGTLARPIDTITTSANIAASQAQEHQSDQWMKKKPSEVQSCLEFLSPISSTFSQAGALIPFLEIFLLPSTQL